MFCSCLFSEDEGLRDLEKQRVRAKYRHPRVLSVSLAGEGSLNRTLSLPESESEQFMKSSRSGFIHRIRAFISLVLTLL